MIEVLILLRSDPPGYLDSNEFIFVLKTLPDGLAVRWRHPRIT